MGNRTCVSCGVEFKPTGKKRWCSVECRRSSSRECTKCKIVKPPGEFYNKGKMPSAYCKTCSLASALRSQQRRMEEDHETWKRKRREYYAGRARNASPEERAWNARRQQLFRYNLSKEQYDQLLADQAWKCAICQVPQENLDRSFDVDHDRTCCPDSRSCGQCVRGLLCNPCNRLLGVARDNKETLKSASEYLTKHQRKEKNK